MAIPKHFKLAKEEPTHYVIHDTRDGRQFPVAKNGLDLQMHGELSKIQHLDDGGTVAINTGVPSAPDSLINQDAGSSLIHTVDPSQQYPTDATLPYGVSAEDWMAAHGNYSGGTPAPESGLTDNAGNPPIRMTGRGRSDDEIIRDQNASLTAGGRTPASKGPSAATSGAPSALNPNGDGNGLLMQDRNAIMAGAKAEGVEGQQNAAAWKGYGDQLSQMPTPEQLFQENQAKDADLQKQYMSKSIDPDRYWNNKSTGSKVAASIGMILGGAGAATAGQPNYAMENINAAINRDIEAQQNDQSKSMNLWKMNRENYQDHNQALLATQNQLLSGVKAKVLQSAGQAAGPEAKARAAQAVSQIDSQMAQNNLKRSYLQMANGGGTSTVEPEKLVPVLVPPEHQKQVFTEIGQARAASQGEDSIMNHFDQAAQDTRPATGRSVTSMMNTIPGYTPPSVKELNALYDPLIHDNEGRINELEQKHVQALTPQWGDSDETVASKKNALKEFINHKKQATTASAFGINTDKFASTSNSPEAKIAVLPPQQQQYARWAMANKNSNPKAQIVLKQLGLN